MLGKYQRCINCMKEIGNNNVCPYCGYIEGSPSLSAYLQPKTVLDQRYIVGKLLSATTVRAQLILPLIP